MKRIAIREPDESINKAVERLEELRFKRYLLASREANREKLNSMSESEVEEVKRIIIDVKRAHYKKLRATKKIYPKKEKFKAWLEKADKEVLAQEKVYLV